MKRSWIITIAVCLLLAAVVAVAVLLPRTVPEAECSDVYRRYAGRDDVAAGYIRDYRINDTVSVDVTVLEAVTDSGWAMMCSDFNILPMTQEMLDFLGPNTVEVRYAPKDDYARPMDTAAMINNDVIAFHWIDSAIYIFRIEHERQFKAVCHEQYNESINLTTSAK